MAWLEEKKKSTPRAPSGLHSGGKALWKQIHAETELDPAQTVILKEACRMVDRLDELDSVIHGKGVLNLMQFRLDLGSGDGSEDSPVKVEVKFNSVLAEARQQQNILKQLLVSLRLPDEAGSRPQKRGSRGAYSGAPQALSGGEPRRAMETALERAKKAAG